MATHGHERFPVVIDVAALAPHGEHPPPRHRSRPHVRAELASGPPRHPGALAGADS